MGKQVVVVASADAAHLTASDGCGKAMSLSVAIVGMSGNVESFADERMLQGETLAASRGECLVDGPRDGAMVHDGMVVARHAESVESDVVGVFIADVSPAVADEARNAVAGHSEGCTS